MEWISVNDRLPEPRKNVWIYWRDREVLIGHRIEWEDEPSEGWYSLEDEKCKWAKWWMPIEKPKPPDKK